MKEDDAEEKEKDKEQDPEEEKIGQKEEKEQEQHIKEFEAFKKKKEEEIEEIKKRIADLEKEKENTITSIEHKKFLEAKEEQKEIEIRIKKLKDSLSSDFSALNRPLKKYRRDTEHNKDLIDRYLEDPATALLEDKEGKITEIMAAMRKKISDGELCSKDKKAEKVVEQLKKINKEYIVFCRKIK